MQFSNLEVNFCDPIDKYIIYTLQKLALGAHLLRLMYM